MNELYELACNNFLVTDEFIKNIRKELEKCEYQEELLKGNKLQSFNEWMVNNKQLVDNELEEEKNLLREEIKTNLRLSKLIPKNKKSSNPRLNSFIQSIQNSPINKRQKVVELSNKIPDYQTDYKRYVDHYKINIEERLRHIQSGIRLSKKELIRRLEMRKDIDGYFGVEE